MTGVLDRPIGELSAESHLRTLVAVLRSHRWSPERTAEWQLRRLQALVAHAHEHVPIFAARGAVPLFSSVEAFGEAVPLIEPSALRFHAEEDRLAGPVPRGTQRFTTSGSTGRTAPVLYPPTQGRLLGALASRMRLLRGIRPHWRRAFVSATAMRSESVERRARLLISATLDADRIAELLDDFRPRVLVGYPHLLVDAGRLRRHPDRLRAVTTFGEQLDTATRRALREVFGVEPVDTYGANEFGALAWQCRFADLYHLNHELVFVEIVDERGAAVPAGTEGRVVVTDLCNSLFPHVRYVVGDVARIATRPCACGHVRPAIEHVAGRQLDWLEAADGSRIAPERLWMDLVVPIAELEPIERYRVHQRADGSVVVWIVPHGSIASEALERIRAGYVAVLGPDLPVEVEVVEEIARTTAGKYPMVTSARAGTDATP